MGGMPEWQDTAILDSLRDCLAVKNINTLVCKLESNFQVVQDKSKTKYHLMPQIIIIVP